MPLPNLKALPVSKGSYTFTELLEQLHAQAFDGTVSLHFRACTPRAVDIGRPWLRLKLRQLDNGGDEA